MAQYWKHKLTIWSHWPCHNKVVSNLGSNTFYLFGPGSSFPFTLGLFGMAACNRFQVTFHWIRHAGRSSEVPCPRWWTSSARRRRRSWPEVASSARCRWAAARCGRAGSFGRPGSRSIPGLRNPSNHLQQEQTSVKLLGCGQEVSVLALYSIN